MLFSAGAAAMEGLLNGIESMAGSIIGAVEHIGSEIGHAISSVLHMASPSRVMFDHGVNTMKGLLLGMQSLHPDLIGSAQDIAGSISNSFGTAAQMSLRAQMSGAGASGGGVGGGDVVVNMNGAELFRILKSDLYRYNVNNGGTATGQWAPH